ncbi:hypothetical protein GCM10009741_04550 [Kribbella lupini]|uniref:Uncharacterized protein n=1 Tax=Kribbella lupini TaxID=291602 RepID=A0ABP4KUE7_9ACTN
MNATLPARPYVGARTTAFPRAAARDLSAAAAPTPSAFPHPHPTACVRQAYVVLDGFNQPAPEQAELVVATEW